MRKRQSAVVFSILSLVFMSAMFAGCGKKASGKVLDRSIVSTGDARRLLHVFTRAENGEDIVIGVIGGSITEGAAANPRSNRYGDLVANWFKKRFKNAKVKYVNAGIEATGSGIAAHRAYRDLLKHNPDFVVTEFAVNDGKGRSFAETYEGLLRQILKQDNNPAVVMLFTMYDNGDNSQESQERLGRHYGLPMVSYRDGVWPEIEAGTMEWSDVGADQAHPNNTGHKYCAEMIINLLELVYDQMPGKGMRPAKIKQIPKPLHTDIFEFAKLHTSDTFVATKNAGFTTATGRLGNVWVSDKPGSSLEFEVEGTHIRVVFWKIKKDMGIATAQVDNHSMINMDGWFEQDWGGYDCEVSVAKDLKPGKHKLTITLLDKKNSNSNGHQFQLRAIMAAGLK